MNTIMQKIAKISVTKLLKMTKGVKPVYHMTGTANAKDLLKTKTLMTPAELVQRGIKPTFEGSLGGDRFNANMYLLPKINIDKNKATMSFKDIASRAFDNKTPDITKRFFLRDVAATRLSGPGRHYAIANIERHGAPNAPKNYSTISASTKNPSVVMVT